MNVVMIIIQLIISIFFIFTSAKILSGKMAQDFARLGYPSMFNQITGIFELVGGLSMLLGIFIHGWAIFASLLLGGTMFVGALSLIFLGKDPIKKALPAITLFILNVAIFIFYI